MSDNDVRSSFVEAFQTIFSAPPYEERFSRRQVVDIVLSYRYDRDFTGRLAFEEESQRVVGFAFGYRLHPDTLDTDEWRRKRLQVRAGDPSDIERFFDGRTFYGDEFGVHPEYQGQGVGAELYDAVYDDLADNPCLERLMLMTMQSDENDATEFYKRRGFEPTGTVVTVYQRRTDGEIRADPRELWVTDLPNGC